MRVFAGLEELCEAGGTELGSSAGLTVSQGMVDAFAELTDDRQWIHVDPVRAATGPFGGPVAHGMLVLSLVPSQLQQLWRVDGASAVVNAGSDRVRFVSPVRVGDRIRVRAELGEVRATDTGCRVVVRATVLTGMTERVACVADCLVRVNGSWRATPPPASPS